MTTNGVRPPIIKFFKLATFSLAVFSILPILGLFFWPFELFSHFYAQYTLLFFGLMLFWLVVQNPKMLLFSLFGFLVSFWFLLPLYYQPQAIAEPNPEKTQELSLFFNNLNYTNDNYQPLINYIKQENPDVITLVEIPQAHYEDLKTLLANYPHTFRQPGANSRLGLVVFSKKPFVYTPYTHYFGESDYPSVEVNLKLKNEPPLSLIVIHPPPPVTPHLSSQRNQVFDGLADYLKKKQLRTVVVGDFNATNFSLNYKQLLKEGNVTDARAGSGVQPSWPSKLPKLLRIPIDHALITKDIQMAQFRLGPDTGSDHLPFSLKILIPQSY